jgi:serine/arginine repetitive matrix protein 1
MKMQVALVGFMDKYGAAAFVDELWKLLSAQKTVGGVPAEVCSLLSFMLPADTSSSSPPRRQNSKKHREGPVDNEAQMRARVDSMRDGPRRVSLPYVGHTSL